MKQETSPEHTPWEESITKRAYRRYPVDTAKGLGSDANSELRAGYINALIECEGQRKEYFNAGLMAERIIWKEKNAALLEDNKRLLAKCEALRIRGDKYRTRLNMQRAEVEALKGALEVMVDIYSKASISTLTNGGTTKERAQEIVSEFPSIIVAKQALNSTNNE